MKVSSRVEGLAWVGFVIAGAVWVLSAYSRRWYLTDEWSMIDRSLGSWSNVFDGYQGHLTVELHLAYRVQGIVLGFGGHAFVWLGLCVSLVAFQVGVALVLRRLGVPTLIALLAATVIAYFGPGAEGMVFEVQQAINLALALSFLAAFVALGDEQSRSRAGAIAGLLFLAVGFDSGLAAFGAVYVGVLVVMLWPRQLAALALIPPLIAHLAWLAFGESGEYLNASFDTMWAFASRLFLIAAGGFVSGGETHSHFEGVPSSPTLPLNGASVGLIALLLASTCVVVGLVGHRLNRKVVASLVGGLSAAVVGVAVLARTRAFLTQPSDLPGLRYVQWIAVFQLLAFGPAVTATLRSESQRSKRVVGSVAAMGLAAVFILNVGQYRPVDRAYEFWGMQVRSRVAQVVDVLSDGCDDSREPARKAMPTPELSPQISVGLIEDLLAEGSLTPQFGTRATPKIRELTCRPSGR